jgi:hypothetical protein
LVRLAGSGTGIKPALERRWRELEKKHYDCSKIMMSKKKSPVSGFGSIKSLDEHFLNLLLED